MRDRVKIKNSTQVPIESLSITLTCKTIHCRVRGHFAARCNLSNVDLDNDLLKGEILTGLVFVAVMGAAVLHAAAGTVDA